MRVTTAFNRMLDIPGASVASVEFSPEGMVVGLRRRSRRLTCPCGWSTRATYDRATRRWRHLDLGASRLFLEGEIRRLWCRACARVRTETVPWARPGARHTRDLEDVVAWLAQRVDKTTVARLLRVAWETVAAIVVRVVREQLDPARLDRLFRIGVDEVSYRKGHRYLTIVADHDRAGAVVWAGEGRSAASLEAFYAELGDERCARLTAVSLDMGAAYQAATDRHAPAAAQCVDPFHVVAAANQALEATRRWAWNRARAQPAAKRPRTPPGRGVITRAGDLVVTSIDHGCLYRITADGCDVLGVTGGGPNGAREGPPDGMSTTFYISQNGGTRPAHRWPFVTGGIQIVHEGGRVDWLTQDPISPNDLCFGPDDLPYCTDPTRGRPRDDGRLWRCDPTTGEAELLCSLPWYPNGIGLGLESDLVYVASTGEQRIWRFPLTDSGLGKPEAFAQLAYGLPDGFAFDADGNLIVAAVGENDGRGQLQTYDRDGKLVDAFEPGPHTKFTNVAVSADGTMLVTDADGGCALVFDWPTPGLPLHPFRASVRP